MKVGFRSFVIQSITECPNTKRNGRTPQGAFFPNTLLLIIRTEETTEPWIRLFGVTVFILGTFFLYMGRRGSKAFAYISLFGRAIFIFGIVSVIIFHAASIQLLLFGIVDLLGFLWTLVAYREK